jgi:hypothetical protein
MNELELAACLARLHPKLAALSAGGGDEETLERFWFLLLGRLAIADPAAGALEHLVAETWAMAAAQPAAPSLRGPRFRRRYDRLRALAALLTAGFSLLGIFLGVYLVFRRDFLSISSEPFFCALTATAGAFMAYHAGSPRRAASELGNRLGVRVQGRRDAAFAALAFYFLVAPVLGVALRYLMDLASIVDFSFGWSKQARLLLELGYLPGALLWLGAAFTAPFFWGAWLYQRLRARLALWAMGRQA